MEKIQLIPGTIDPIRLLKDLGSKLFLFTNQSGVSLGKYTMTDVDACNERLIKLIEIPECFTEVCVAVELPNPEKSYFYRKPSPRLILEMIEKYNLLPKNCYMVGDKDMDALAGINAGIHAIHVATGNHNTELMTNLLNSKQAKSFRNLLEFTKFITTDSDPA